MIENIQERIKDVIESNTSVDREEIDSNFSIFALNDSDLVLALVFLEEEFDISIPLTDEHLLTTIDKTAEYIILNKL